MKYYKDKNFVILIKNLFDTIELNILLNPLFFSVYDNIYNIKSLVDIVGKNAAAKFVE